MRERPREIRPPHVYGNFRTPTEKKPKHVSAQKKRDGNDEKHLALVRQLPCCIPGCRRGPPNDPHHLKHGPAKPERAYGRKATDRRVIPACRVHHNLIETEPGNKEEAILADLGLGNPHGLAEDLWKASREKESAMLVEKMTGIVMKHRQD